MNAAAAVAAPPAPQADLAAIKNRQRATWASGDFAIIGNTLQIVGESLCEAVDLRSGARVLDVCAGNGNCSLAAARRWAEVTSTDYVPALLADGERRAAADRLAITFQEADVEALPFADTSFDVVLSSFGVMFAPDHARAAQEMLRVCRSQGRIGLANWTPRGFIGRLFGVIGRHVPPPAGLLSPAKWGTREHLEALFGAQAADTRTTTRDFTFRYRSPSHWVDVFRTWYGPTVKAFAALPAEGQAQLERDILALLGEFNVSGDDTLVAPGEYLEVVVVKR
ncbi:MAG: class I SAM-dependent methyltransferase [Vicinamibacterales bacterium]